MRGVKRKNGEDWKKYAIFCLLLILLAVLGNSTRKVYNKKAETEKALLRMQEETLELEDRKEILEANLKRIQTDEGMEFEIRKKFNVARAGEGIAIIVEEKSTSPDSTTSLSFWQKFKNFFINVFR